MQPESDFVSVIMSWKVGKDSLKVITNTQGCEIRYGQDSCKHQGEIVNLENCFAGIFKRLFHFKVIRIGNQSAEDVLWVWLMLTEHFIWSLRELAN